ncbi:MAG: hypothetical protein J6Y02_06360 [Pseudobutyrivibrio sp.]|nr:hypothetical protein [Pseudobutyrivibrio sp.]
MDFYKIKTKEIGSKKNPIVEIYPDFQTFRIKDLMVRSKEFYAIWDEELGRWSQDQDEVIRMVDNDLHNYYENHKNEFADAEVHIKYMRDYGSGVLDKFQKFAKTLTDNYKQLDCKVVFANTPTTKKDYVSKSLPYAKEQGDISAYEELISTLYDPDERRKIEWAIGSVIEGDSKTNQKFFVFYGPPGTGKSTVLDIIQAMFEGYWESFESKALGSSNNLFATEMFKSNPLLAIEQDGDLSRIEDNTKLNSIVSHDIIVVNEKHKAQYKMRFNALLLIGTNKPVKITDEKSGLRRRLVDINPSGRTVSRDRYYELKDEIIKCELGAIADHCHEIYKSLGKDYYRKYEPQEMQMMTDHFLNFVEENYDLFKKQNYTTLSQAYDLYKAYVEDAGIPFKFTKPEVRYKLKDYFEEFKEEDRVMIGNETKHVRSYYFGFKTEKFSRTVIDASNELKPRKTWLEFKEHLNSVLDDYLKDYPAQYATAKETPSYKWLNCKTILKDIDTKKLHYVKVPENLIVLDFDIKDENGNKSFEKNLEAASKFPKTYAELSKSGAGIHLHYLYSGDVSQLERVYGPDIEVKVFTGDSSLRRKLTKCNDLPISKLNSGLPLKEKKEVNMVNQETIKSEKGLRNLIIRNLRKEIHPGTKPSIDFIYKILEDTYKSGLKYDVSDLYPDIAAFAAGSTHQAEYCMNLVSKMKFKSEEDPEPDKDIDERIVFYDVEVFPNLFLINWKFQGKDNQVVRMINPTPEEVEALTKFRLVGFNCRRYDNHILYARMMGASNEELFDISQKIVNGSENAFFSNAYNISYTDVYDFCATKQSLKKWEITLGIHHHELGFKWDEPVPEDKWQLVAEYCDDDVIATEAVFDANQGDFTARQILADLAGGTVNDTTNSLTGKLIFGKDKKPQSKFYYRDLSKPVTEITPEQKEFLKVNYPHILDKPFVENGVKSILPFFPEYTFDKGKSIYLDEEVGEGGEVWAAPGMYGRTKTFDVRSQHPNSAGAEYLFGIYTQRFLDLVNARAYIKHGDIDKAAQLFDGKLIPYLKDKSTIKQLSYALKIAINSVYGLTAAKFDNLFKDNRNKDNIVAKRGALFMIKLRHEVQKRGGKVIHIKTDSIKVLDPSPEIESFIMSFGERYGYSFEIEHIFEKICLVNNAVYIAKCAKDDPESPGEWTATGTQFAVPYVFKTLFSKEPIEFKDLCETKSVSSGAMYLDMNESLDDVSAYESELSNRTYNTKLKTEGYHGSSGTGSPIPKFKKLNPELEKYSDTQLVELINSGHRYTFVGKTGLFSPIKKGCSGGLLYREKDGKYYAVTGTSGYRWLESEIVKSLGKDGDIDISYYENLKKEAIDTIEKFGNYENFISDDFVATPFGGEIIK